MATTVDIVVSFYCAQPEPVQALAAAYLRREAAEGSPASWGWTHGSAAPWGTAGHDLLEQIAGGRAYSGEFGRRFTAGTQSWRGDIADMDGFVRSLTAFWQDLLWGSMEDPQHYHGPYPDNSVLVLYQWEYEEWASAYQLRLAGADHQEDWPLLPPGDPWRPDLVVTHHAPLPISLS